MDRISVYDRITRQIISDLESGVLPWTKPWNGVGRANFSSRRRLWQSSETPRTSHNRARATLHSQPRS